MIKTPNLLTKTQAWGQGEYLWARDYWDKQQAAHWLHHEASLAADITDWKSKLTDSERHIIGSILKTFTQAECIVSEYWSSKVARWFPKPEIVATALCFGSVETIHVRGYAALNEALGLDSEFKSFLESPELSKKITQLEECQGIKASEEQGDGLDYVRDVAYSLAVFSAFTEGVALFSSFAALASFRMRNLMKGTGNIIEWSVIDEGCHSEFGCRLFRELIQECPEIWVDDFKRLIYQAARNTIETEDACIDLIFAQGDLPNLTSHDLKNYMRFRANDRLQALGLKKNWKNIDNEALERIAWFNSFTGGVKQTDFFSGRVTDYRRVEVTDELLWG